MLFLKNYLLITIFTLTLCTTAIERSFAQSNVERPITVDDIENTPPATDSSDVGPAGEDLTNPFQISMELGTQSPWSKKIPVKVTFTPKLNSSRTQVSWDLPLGFTVEKKYNEYFSANAGQTYTVEAVIDPKQAGTHNFVVNITNWGYGSNVTSSSRLTVTLDQNLVVTPRTAGYETASLVRYIVITLILITLLIASWFGIRKGTEKLKIWLKPPH